MEFSFLRFLVLVAVPLLFPSTLSAPSQDKHAIQPSVSSHSGTPHEAIPWVANEPSPNIQREGHLYDGTEAEKAGKDHQVSPPTETQEPEGSVNTEGSVVGKEHTQIAKEANNGEITSESSKEVPLFLEEEDDQGWGLGEPAPRPPFFLQSPNLEDVYDDEEDESLHTSDGVPWLPGSKPRVEIGSSSERPTINPSHELPTSTVEPWPANKSPDQSAADAVHVREGKAIGVSHIDQQPKQEQKQVEVSDGSNVSVLTTPTPTKFDVDSSPVKSSSKSNSTMVVVGKEDEVRKENDTLDSSGPLTVNSSSSNSDEKVKKEEESEGTQSPPVISEEVMVKDKEEGVERADDEKEIESKNNTGSVVETSDSDVGKPTQEEEIISPVEVPTAVAVREGGIKSSQPEENKDNDGSEEPSKSADKETITTAADVPSSVHQGRMTAPRSLDAASIVGISLGSVLLVGAVAGGVGFVLYRRSLYANKPQTLNDKCSNPDSSGYIDDTLRVSSACTSARGPRPAPRSRVEVTRNSGRGRRGGGRGGGGGGEGGKQRRPSGAKENSEEMYSLDNDSFLNSLEAMTIQNYWTDSVKHTKL